MEKYIAPDKGRRHVLRVVRDVLFHQPQGHRTDVAKALDYLLRVSKRRAIVFVVSDFLSPDFSRPLAMAARKHDVVAVWLTDPREEKIENAGLVRVWDQEAQIERLIDTGSRLSVFGGYLLGAALMVVAGVIAAVFCVPAERKQLEAVARPLAFTA